MTNAALRLLIVDDEPMLRSVMVEFLDLLGYEDVSLAGDGREALEVLRSKPIDCMISDIRMPEMELEELLPIVQREFPQLTVIASSGYSDFNSAANILRKGAADFIGKPLNFDCLELAMQWIEHRRRLIALGRRHFGPAVEPLGEAGLAEGVRVMAAELNRAGVFQQALAHSARVMELGLALALHWPAGERAILAAAAALHELGLNYQIYQVCQQPRKLEPPEYQLVMYAVQAQAQITASLVGYPELQPMIAEHLDWGNAHALGVEAPLAERGAIWLGIANSIDGFLHERPDRPATTLPKLHEWLTRRYERRGCGLLRYWLDHWSAVEGFYARPN